MRVTRPILISVVLLAAISITLSVVYAGDFTDIDYHYTCNACGRSWYTRTTYIWNIPIWHRTIGEHPTDHIPTYNRGGFSRTSWTVLDGVTVTSSGRHTERSP